MEPGIAMATIISSAVIANNPQKDGRSVVSEQYVDDKGNVFTYDYMADAGTDLNAHLAARIPDVLADATAMQFEQAGG
jgi:hypothetical protein